MKRIFTPLFLFMCMTSGAQTYFTTGYSASVPLQKMAQNINPVHSFHLGIYRQLPGKLSRIQAGVETSWGLYASENRRQTFRFDNGDVTEVGVNYNSNAVQTNLLMRVMLNQGKKITPYLIGKAGYSMFYSNVFVEDPLSADACRALEQENIISDGTITGAYGAGATLDFSLFSKKARKFRQQIDIGIQHVRGGNIDYINTKRLYDANNPPTDSEGKPLMVNFINASTQRIHEHQVAEVFTSPLRLLEFRISYIFKF
ncbi:MAG: hypothetical protein NTW29_08100 [Bacteroidetes bacterium]|nr:hypothetical protein [Bacteroidota bacterium]